VTCLAFHPTFSLVVSTSEDGSVKVWDLELNQLLKTLKGHIGCVNWISFSASGEEFATASVDTNVKLWNTQ